MVAPKIPTFMHVAMKWKLGVRKTLDKSQL